MPISFDQISEPLPARVTTGLARIGAALRAQSWKQGEAVGLSPTQAQILSYLRARGGGPVQLTAIAGELSVTLATASDSVAALAAKGLIDKRRAEDDRRAVAIRLTGAGRARTDEIAAWPDFLLRAVDTLTGAEQALLLRALVKMIRTLQERGEIPIARICVTCRHFRPRVHDDPDAPHHCAFVDAAFGDRHLRIDCTDHEEAPEPSRHSNWLAFADLGPTTQMP